MSTPPKSPAGGNGGSSSTKDFDIARSNENSVTKKQAMTLKGIIVSGKDKLKSNANATVKIVGAAGSGVMGVMSNVTSNVQSMKLTRSGDSDRDTSKMSIKELMELQLGGGKDKDDAPVEKGKRMKNLLSSYYV